MKHLTAQPDLSALAEPYRGVIARAMEKDPARRFPSVGEMLSQLPLPAGAGLGANAAFLGPEALSPPSMRTEAEPGEPVLWAVRQFWREGRERWMRSRWNSDPTKRAFAILLAAFVIVCVCLTTPWWAPVAAVILVFYGIYRAIRAVVLLFVGKPAGPPGASGLDAMRPIPLREPPPGPPNGSGLAQPVPPATVHVASQANPSTGRTPGQLQAALDAAVPRTVRQRAAELVGSLVGGALVAMIVALAAMIVRGYAASAPPRIEEVAWLALVGILGTWAVLIPSKLWEGAPEEPALRRFTLMVLGMGLGLVAWQTAAALFLHLPHLAQLPLPNAYPLIGGFYEADGTPLALAHVAAFGTLFLLMRWWRQAERGRAARFRLPTVIATMLIAGLIAAAWHFPQPWLVMVAVTISVSVQLASPWSRPSPRRWSANRPPT